MRPSKLKTYMEIAETVAKRSHDADTKVGAVLIKNDTGAIIATGFNGFVRGVHDNQLPNTRPDKYPYIVHAETNIMANCCRHGIATDNCTLICTLSPCVSCMRMLYQAGLTTVIAKTKYRDFDNILKMKDIGILETMTDEGYYKLTYKVPEI